MSEIKLNIGGNTLELSGDDLYCADKIVSGFYETSKELQVAPMALLETAAEPLREAALCHEPDIQPGIEHDIVAIYDDAGIPSIMRRFRKVTNKELFGGSDKVNAAFLIGGKEYDELYISVYENCEINGKPYSLPFMKPWTNITNDDAAKACFSKGEGWHLMTAPEWGLLANLCFKNNTFPHGNTNCGKYHADADEKGVTYDSYRTLTGSGPSTWTHDHTPFGVHDLCGNVWEMLRGMRVKNGRLDAAQNNDAALDIDLFAESNLWHPVLDDKGKAVRFSVESEGCIKITSDEDITHNYDGVEWRDVLIECDSEHLKELALYDGELNAYLYVDSTEGEYFPVRGGDWGSTGDAGVFASDFRNPRSYSNVNNGFRSAFFRKR